MFLTLCMRRNCRAARLSATGLAVALIMLAAAPLRADTYNWVVSSGDWSNSGNWLDLSSSSGTTLPTSYDTAYVVNGGTVNVTTASPTCGTLTLGTTAGSGTIKMSGGSLGSSYYAYMGKSGTGPSCSQGEPAIPVSYISAMTLPALERTL